MDFFEESRAIVIDDWHSIADFLTTHPKTMVAGAVVVTAVIVAAGRTIVKNILADHRAEKTHKAEMEALRKKYDAFLTKLRQS